MTDNTIRLPLDISNEFIVSLPQDVVFGTHLAGDIQLLEEQQRVVDADWRKTGKSDDFNGTVYGATIFAELDSSPLIYIDLLKSNYAHKRVAGKVVDGVQINELSRCNAPILVELLDPMTKQSIGYVFGLHRNGHIIVPGGVVDDDRAVAKEPLRANATAELHEEFGLELNHAQTSRFAYWIHEGAMNHFLVKAKFYGTIEWFHEVFSSRTSNEMQGYVIVRDMDDIALLAGGPLPELHHLEVDCPADPEGDRRPLQVRTVLPQGSKYPIRRLLT